MTPQDPLYPLDLEGGVLALEIGNESLKTGIRAQAFEMWIHLEERPAGIARVDATLQPSHRLFRFAQDGVNAGDLIIGVVRVADGNREIESLLHTLQRRVGFMAPGMQHALKTDEQGFIGE